MTPEKRKALAAQMKAEMSADLKDRGPKPIATADLVVKQPPQRQSTGSTETLGQRQNQSAKSEMKTKTASDTSMHAQRPTTDIPGGNSVTIGAIKQPPKEQLTERQETVGQLRNQSARSDTRTKTANDTSMHAQRIATETPTVTIDRTPTNMKNAKITLNDDVSKLVDEPGAPITSHSQMKTKTTTDIALKEESDRRQTGALADQPDSDFPKSEIDLESPKNVDHKRQLRQTNADKSKMSPKQGGHDLKIEGSPGKGSHTSSPEKPILTTTNFYSSSDRGAPPPCDPKLKPEEADDDAVLSTAVYPVTIAGLDLRTPTITYGEHDRFGEFNNGMDDMVEKLRKESTEYRKEVLRLTRENLSQKHKSDIDKISLQMMSDEIKYLEKKLKACDEKLNRFDNEWRSKSRATSGETIFQKTDTPGISTHKYKANSIEEENVDNADTIDRVSSQLYNDVAFLETAFLSNTKTNRTISPLQKTSQKPLQNERPITSQPVGFYYPEGKTKTESMLNDPSLQEKSLYYSALGHVLTEKIPPKPLLRTVPKQSQNLQSDKTVATHDRIDASDYSYRYTTPSANNLNNARFKLNSSHNFAARDITLPSNNRSIDLLLRMKDRPTLLPKYCKSMVRGSGLEDNTSVGYSHTPPDETCRSCGLPVNSINYNATEKASFLPNGNAPGNMDYQLTCDVGSLRLNGDRLIDAYLARIGIYPTIV